MKSTYKTCAVYSDSFVFTVCSEMTNQVTFATNVNDDSSIKNDIDGTVINDMDMVGDYFSISPYQ